MFKQIKARAAEIGIVVVAVILLLSIFGASWRYKLSQVGIVTDGQNITMGGDLEISGVFRGNFVDLNPTNPKAAQVEMFMNEPPETSDTLTVAGMTYTFAMPGSKAKAVLWLSSGYCSQFATDRFTIADPERNQVLQYVFYENSGAFTAANQIRIGDSVIEEASNLCDALNGATRVVEGYEKYSLGTVQLSGFTATWETDEERIKITIEADEVGTAYNNYFIDTTCSYFSYYDENDPQTWHDALRTHGGGTDFTDTSTPLISIDVDSVPQLFSNIKAAINKETRLVGGSYLYNSAVVQNPYVYAETPSSNVLLIKANDNGSAGDEYSITSTAGFSYDPTNGTFEAGAVGTASKQGQLAIYINNNEATLNVGIVNGDTTTAQWKRLGESFTSVGN